MKHEIDLSKYKVRTDLAVEAINDTKIKGIEQIIRKENDIVITDVKVDINGSKVINKKPGNYITIEFKDITDNDNYNNVKKVFIHELKKMINILKIDNKDLCLIIGLGNDKSTPDALGPCTIDNILVTNHLYLLHELENGYRRVCTFKPGVTGETGIETSDTIKSIVRSINPDFIIVVDALASQSIERVNKTIQMTDTGIAPGSGVGNSRKEISEQILNVPVIAIGIPTVVDAVTIVSDTINYMYKHYSYSYKNRNNPLNKLKIKDSDFTKYELKQEDKKIFGILGNLNEKETKQLIYEVLSPIDYNLMVTPKEIDFLIKKLSLLLSTGINSSLHKKY